MRLNEDLTRGTTTKRLLEKKGQTELEHIDEAFEVGLVETYRFRRDVDNKPVDKVNQWQGLFD